MKWFVLLLMMFSLSQGHAQSVVMDQSGSIVDLPQPLPDDPNGPNPNPNPNPPPPMQQVPITMGTAQLSRFGDTRITLNAKQGFNRLIRFSLTAGVNNIEISEVRIQYADYAEERLDYTLPGDLSVGQMRTIALDGRPIYRIIVTASPSYVWKSPGTIRADAVVYR